MKNKPGVLNTSNYFQFGLTATTSHKSSLAKCDRNETDPERQRGPDVTGGGASGSWTGQNRSQTGCRVNP